MNRFSLMLALASLALLAESTHAQVDLGGLSRVKKVASAYDGDIRIERGSTITLNFDVANSTGFLLQAGKVPGAAFNFNKPSVGFTFPDRQVRDPKSGQLVSKKWNFPKGTSFRVTRIAVYPPFSEFDRIELEILAEAGDASVRITADSDWGSRRIMPSDVFRRCLGDAISISPPSQ